MEDKLSFYKVNADYVHFLKQAEIQRYGKSCVPDVVYAPNRQEKFMCGIVLEIGDKKYVAPVSSYSLQKPDNFLLLDTNGNVTSSIRFNYMFPVVEGTYSLYDFNQEVDEQYKSVIRQEYQYVNEHRELVLKQAKETYRRANHFLDTNGRLPWACDFRLLEQAAERWNTLTLTAVQTGAWTGTETQKTLHDGFSILHDERSDTWYLLKDGFPKANGKELLVGDTATTSELLKAYSEDSAQTLLTAFPDKAAALDYWAKESATYVALRKDNPSLNQSTARTQGFIDTSIPADFKAVLAPIQQGGTSPVLDIEHERE